MKTLMSFFLILFVALSSAIGQTWQKNYAIQGVNFHDLNIEKIQDCSHDLFVAGAIFDNTFANPEISLFRMDEITGDVIYQTGFSPKADITNPRVFDIACFQENDIEMIAITGSVEIDGKQRLAIIKVNASTGAFHAGAYYFNMDPDLEHSQGLHIIYTKLNNEPGFVVGGFCNNDYDESTYDSHAGFVMRTYLNLDIKWAKSMNSSNAANTFDYDMVNNITQTGAGFFVTGSCNKTDGLNTRQAVLAVRLYPNTGDLKWNKSYIYSNVENSHDVGADAFYDSQNDEIFLLCNYSSVQSFGVTVFDDNTGTFSRSWWTYMVDDIDKYGFRITKSVTEDNNLVISGYDRDASWIDENGDPETGQTVPFMYEFDKATGAMAGICYLYHIPYTHPAGFSDYFNFWTAQMPLIYYPDIHLPLNADEQNFGESYFQVAYRNQPVSGEVVMEVIKTDNALLNACEYEILDSDTQLADLDTVGINIYYAQPELEELELAVKSYDFEIDSCFSDPRDFDFGDAPEDPSASIKYATTLVYNGARHIFDPNVYMGTLIDSEPDGQPSVNADCDDNDCFYPPMVDDEDGVVLTDMVYTGTTDSIEVTVSVAGYLDGWFDFNVDGDWADVGEHILIIHPVSTGPNKIYYTIPFNATLGQSYMRFRFRSDSLPVRYFGQAEDGEVEDYPVKIKPAIDFGDAPNNYSTLDADNGACHEIDGVTFLGTIVDAEPDGQPSPHALGDDNNGADDEDGVRFLKRMKRGKNTRIEVTASADGILNAWADFNRNGSWADAGEQIFIDTSLMEGVHTLKFAVPFFASVGRTYLRFRFSTVSGLTYEGWAANGEVEDYRRSILPGWTLTPTDNYHIIEWPLDVLPIKTGDLVGVFHTNELGEEACAGLIYLGEEPDGQMIVFGDDLTTPVIKEGFTEGEVIKWKVFSLDSEKIHDLTIVYDPSMPNSDGTFVPDGISAVSQIHGVLLDCVPETANICEGSTLQMTAIAEGGSWDYTCNWTSSPEGFISDQMAVEVQPEENTIYYAEVFDGLFTARDSVMVTVSPGPIANAGPDITICEFEPVALVGSAENYSAMEWQTTGDGFFDDPTLLQTSYFVGINDIENGYVHLTLTAYPQEGCQIYALDTTQITLPNTQEIQLINGWQGISSYLSPVDSNLESLMSPLGDHLVIMHNNQGLVYWPIYGINTLETWEDYGAYILKTNSEDILYICGSRLESMEVQLTNSWNLIPVLCETQAPVDAVFAGLDGMVLVKEIGGTGIYWNTYNVNTLGFLESGKAYLGYTSNIGVISYSGNCDTDGFKDAKIINPEPTHALPWNEVIKTLNTHIIGISDDFAAKYAGGIIGVFNSDGVCVGFAEITQKDHVIIAFGDDLSTPEIEGITENEIMNFRMYNPKNKVEQSVSPVFDNSFPHNDGLFVTNGISGITNVVSVNENVIDRGIRIFPNPAKEVINVKFDTFDGDYKLTIYDLMGRAVMTKGLSGSSIQTLNVGSLPKGIYYVEINIAGYKHTQKLVIH